MTRQETVRASWDALAEPWRTAIEVAWQAYRAGGIAVGAVLTDSAGTVIGEGRNQRFAGPAKGLLAHAEMGVLAVIPPDKDRARDSVLYTTTPRCRAAGRRSTVLSPGRSEHGWRSHRA